MFEEARNQLEQQITKSADNQPNAEPASDLAPEGGTEPAKQSLEAVADLSKFQKILLDGKELTLADLKKERMLEADYRRKTMEHAEKAKRFEQESKFAVNFPKDLDVVMQEPWRAAEFYEAYPEQYHAQVRRIEQMYKQNPAMWAQDQGETEQSNSDNSVDVESLVEERIQRALKPFQEKEEREQQKLHLAQLDAIETRLTAKYKRANKHEVYAMAEYLSNDGKELDDAAWEKIYKDSHERNLKMIKAAYAEEFNQQKAAGQKLKDVPSGGGIPGEAPIVPRTLKEATAQIMKQYNR
jgi:hypothetical protein